MSELRPVFTDIANAIRTKAGTTEKITPLDMPAAITNIKSGAENVSIDITSNGTYTAPEGQGYSPVNVNVPQDGAPTAEDLTITGDCQYKFSNGGWDWIIKKYGNQITTKDIINCFFMFYYSNLENIPFEINCDINRSVSFSNFCSGCDNLLEVPKINNAKATEMDHMFSSCKKLKEYPPDMDSWFDWSEIDGATSQWGSSMSALCFGNRAIRKPPYCMLKHGNPGSYTSYSIYYQGFSLCTSLDEIINLPNPHYNSKWDSNAFYDCFNYCNHLKDLTFAPTMTNGEPNNPQWSNQTIDLTKDIGYGWDYDNFYLPVEKQIKDDATYQQFKDDPDAWTQLQEYSRYNHDSAVRTINSLPDTSAYIASNGGTNNIKFGGANGSKTDGGAINTLTEQEIAVATAKGWTVSLV